MRLVHVSCLMLFLSCFACEELGTYNNIIANNIRTWNSFKEDAHFSEAYTSKTQQSHLFSNILNGLKTDVLNGNNKRLLHLSNDFNVSQVCMNSTLDIIVGVEKNISWAIHMLDSFGKPSAGILEGNLAWLGVYEECKAIKEAVSTSGIKFNGQYCGINLLPSSMMGGQPTTLQYGMCLPSVCSVEDVSALVSSVFFMVKNSTEGIPPVTCAKDSVPFDARAIVAICIFSIFAFLVVVASFLDIWQQHISSLFSSGNDYEVLKKDEKEINGENEALGVGEHTPLLKKESDNVPQLIHADPLWQGILKSFSIYTNTQKLFTVGHSSDTLSCIHGIRFLSMTWVLLGHSFAFLFAYYGNLLTFFSVTLRTSFLIIASGTFAVDSFFMLSGLLVAYLFFLEKKKGGKINLLYFYIHRYLRLTPAYMLVMMADICLVRFLGDGPLYPSETGFEVNFCKDSWYKNLLYVNTISAKDMCMGWSWYLGNDMVFYWLSPLMLFAFAWKPIAGLLVSLVFLLTSCFTALGVSLHYKYGAGLMTMTTALSNDHSYMMDIYFRPWTRMGPYVIGILAGYLLVVIPKGYRIPKLGVVGGWCAAAVVALSIVFGLNGNTHGHKVSVAASGIYNGFSTTAWGIVLAFVIIMCHIGYGGFVNSLLSWKALIPLSRLTYCCYLVHPLVLFFFGGSIKQKMHYDDFHHVVTFLGVVIVTYIIAFFTSMCLEVPFMLIEKKVIGAFRKSKSSNS